ncbi:hypothetical protein T484DRAFT_1748800 [Baffinella frigidus]|nr:hypothetical protein T484DRAFT_1748800 [Cryptophyta sp. CCMP2293]
MIYDHQLPPIHAKILSSAKPRASASVPRPTRASSAEARVLTGCEQPLDHYPGDSFMIRPPISDSSFARASSCPSRPCPSSWDEEAHRRFIAADFFLDAPPPPSFCRMTLAPSAYLPCLPSQPAETNTPSRELATETLRASRDHPCISSRRSGAFLPSLRAIPSSPLCAPVRVTPPRGRRTGALLKMAPRTF